ncbi:hypothetical protein [Peribacillus sp. NPDC097295]|uniref:hypothetical protein n=1 Tax=Peribacillus sp. NPDC097295 TaxID=3364402 RepID=UPI00380FDC76
MGKKKAIKLATATAIAASAFVAVAPTQSEAATSSVDKAITKASSSMVKAFNTYNKTAREDQKLPALSTIKKDVKAAQDAYKAATKEIASKGGTKAQKAKLTVKLDTNKKYLDRAELYLKAVTTNLNPTKTAFTEAVASGTQSKVLSTQKAYQAKIAEFEANVKKVYGPDARNLLTAKYADAANKLANSVNEEMTVYKAYKEISVLVDKKDLEAAEKLIADTKDSADKVAKLDTKLAKNITSAVVKINKKLEDAKVPTVKEVSAVNAKTIEVKFSKAVDTEKATIEVLRGAFKQNVTATWSTDKKSVQLVAATNFQAADYTVNVSGLTKEVMTGSVKFEAQKVASIAILDEIAVVSSAIAPATGVFPANTTATVGYVVKDQYGTDITKTTDLTTNDSTNITFNKANGVITLGSSLVAGKRINDLVPVVLIDQNTGTSTTKTLKLSATSAVSSIAVTGIFNAKGEAVSLTDKSKANEAFIVLDLKDQYGKAITNAGLASGLVLTNTNPFNLTLATTPAVYEQTIGGKNQLVLKISEIKKAGNTDILLISTTNGQSTKYTVNVSETSATDGISASQPEIAVANEATLIPLTVTDKDGNVITDKALLSNATKGIKVGTTPVTPTDLEVKDGQVFYKKTFTTEGTQALVFQSSTYKVATLTVNVKAAAIPTVVRGLKNPLVLSTEKGPVTLTAEDHLIIEDQYGRVLKDSSAPVRVTLVGTTDVVTVAGNSITPVKNGSATLNIALTTENGTIDSDVEVKVQVTDGTEYTGYEIAEIGKTQVATDKAFTVNGLLNNGKVALTKNEYTATITGGKLSADSLTDGKFNVAASALDTNAAGTPIDTEFTLKVTINATGKVLERKFVISPAAPTVSDFFFTTTEATGNYATAKAVTEATLLSGSTVANLKADEAKLTVNTATVDQYGNKKVVPTSATTVTIVPEKVADVKITNNGKANASVELKSGVQESTVTFKVTVGAATKEIKVKVVPAT